MQWVDSVDWVEVDVNIERIETRGGEEEEGRRYSLSISHFDRKTGGRADGRKNAGQVPQPNRAPR